jgi:hypothetical protein
MPGTRDFSVGRRVHGRSEDRELSTVWLHQLITGRRAGPLQGRSHPEGWPARDCVTRALEADSCPHGPCCAGALHVMRSGQPRVDLLLEEGVSSTRRSRSWTNQSWSRPLLRATSACHRSGGAGGAKPAPARRRLRRGVWLKRLQVGQPGSAVFRDRGNPEVSPTLLQRSHADTSISVRFRCSRRSTPPDSSDGHLPDSAPEETDAHLAILRGRSRETFPRKGTQASEEAGCCPCRRSGRPASGRVTPEGDRCVRPGPDKQAAVARASGPAEGAARRTESSR